MNSTIIDAFANVTLFILVSFFKTIEQTIIITINASEIHRKTHGSIKSPLRYKVIIWSQDTNQTKEPSAFPMCCLLLLQKIPFPIPKMPSSWCLQITLVVIPPNTSLWFSKLKWEGWAVRGNGEVGPVMCRWRGFHVYPAESTLLREIKG